MEDRKELDTEKAQQEAEKFLEGLLQERREIDQKIAGWRIVVNGYKSLRDAEKQKYKLEPLPLEQEYEGIRAAGLTDAIRKVFENATEALTPKDVLSKLKSLEYPHLPKGNQLAAVHGIYTRLKKAGEIEPVAGAGKNACRWIPSGGLYPRNSRINYYRPGSRAYLEFERKRREELEGILRETVLSTTKK